MLEPEIAKVELFLAKQELECGMGTEEGGGVPVVRSPGDRDLDLGVMSIQNVELGAEGRHEDGSGDWMRVRDEMAGGSSV